MTQRIFRKHRGVQNTSSNAMGDVLAAFAALGDAGRAKEVVERLRIEQNAVNEATNNMRAEAERLDEIRKQAVEKLDSISKAQKRLDEKEADLQAKETAARTAATKLATQKAKLEDEQEKHKTAKMHIDARLADVVLREQQILKHMNQIKEQELELALGKQAFEEDMKTLAAAKDEMQSKEDSMAKLEARLNQLRSLLNT